MKVALLGLPKSGKSTVFSALTGLDAGAAGKGGGRSGQIGVIKVPDERVEFLASVFKPKKITLAEISFVDLPGGEPTKGAGVFADAQATAEARKMEALVVVVRAFESDALPHPEGSVDPRRDAEAVDLELLLSDMQVIEKKRDRMKRENAKGAERDAIEKCAETLGKERPLREAGLAEEEKATLAGYQLLTLKPLILLANADERGSVDLGPLSAYAQKEGHTLLSLCAPMEAEIARLAPEDQTAFLEDLGVAESVRARFIHAVYEKMSLISFLTAGPDECRAWTIRRGTAAQQAAGKIHTDIERGFIRAEVIHFADFKASPDKTALKGAGKVRLEGKTYEVKDGDIVEFRFNV